MKLLFFLSIVVILEDARAPFSRSVKCIVYAYNTISYYNPVLLVLRGCY